MKDNRLVGCNKGGGYNAGTLVHSGTFCYILLHSGTQVKYDCATSRILQQQGWLFRKNYISTLSSCLR